MHRRSFLRFLPAAAAVPLLGSLATMLPAAEPGVQGTAVELLPGITETAVLGETDLQQVWDTLSEQEARLQFLESGGQP